MERSRSSSSRDPGQRPSRRLRRRAFLRVAALDRPTGTARTAFEVSGVAPAGENAGAPANTSPSATSRTPPSLVVDCSRSGPLCCPSVAVGAAHASATAPSLHEAATRVWAAVGPVRAKERRSTALDGSTRGTPAAQLARRRRLGRTQYVTTGRPGLSMRGPKPSAISLGWLMTAGSPSETNLSSGLSLNFLMAFSRALPVTMMRGMW